jgi:tRNA threonylcarbamoyladenosine biosynthesis protein TsaB
MSTLIALETSTETASVALLHKGVMHCLESTGVQTHSQSVLPMVQRLLADSGLTMKDCDAIAFGAGPGSFTGVRTACGIAQGLAYGAGLPVVPVVTLVAMAEACRGETGAQEVLSLLDARMDEVYWAQYRFDGSWTTVVEPTLSRADAVVARFADDADDATGSPTVVPVTACGNGLSVYASHFEGKAFAAAGHPAIMPHARWIAALAEKEVAAGRTINARDAQPVYLRNKVAMTTAERTAKVAA